MKRTKSILFFILKLIVVFLAYYFLVIRLLAFGDWDSLWQQMVHGVRFIQISIFIVILFFVNWTLATHIWRIFVAPYERISFSKSLHSMLLGTVSGSITPGKVGVWPGKMLVFEESMRLKIVFVAVLASVLEIIALFIPGFLAFTQFLNKNMLFEQFQLQIPFSLALFFELVLIGAILILPKYASRINRLNFSNKWKKNLQIFTSYSSSKLGFLLSLSVLRTVVYFVQFFLMLQLFGVPITIEHGLILIPCYYFVLSYIPGFILSDMGVRGAISVLIIGAIYPQHPAIALAAMALWVINIGIPIAIGSLLLLKYKSQIR